MTLTRRDVMRVVNQYIGVSGGYLGDFSYRTHADFYPEYCDLDIDPNAIEGTTRERFIEILSSATAADQAKILRGVTARFPAGAGDAPATRTEALRQELESIAARLASAPRIATPDISVDADVVRQALDDAELLINGSGATSGVDRIHTALHGYLHALCEAAEIEAQDDAAVTRLFRLLRERHPALTPTGPRADDVTRILRAFGTVVDALNTLRNQASAAHPRDRLEPPEAMLAIHAARTLLHYIEARLQQHEETP